MGVQIAGIRCIDPRSLKQSFDLVDLPTGTFWEAANSMQYHLNDEMDRGYFLVPASDANTLTSTATNIPSITVIFTDGTNTLTLNSLFLISVSQLTGKAFGANGNEPCILEVCSIKCQYQNQLIGKNYNVLRDIPYPPISTVNEFLYEAETLDAGTPWTWATMLEDVLGYVPNNVNLLPSYAPENVQAVNATALELLSVVAKETGVPYYIDASGQVTFTSDTEFTEAQFVSALGQPEYRMAVNPNIQFPPGIRVHIPTTEYHCVDSNCSNSPENGAMVCTNPDGFLEEGDLTWGETNTIYPHATRKLEPTGTVNNESDITTLTEQIWDSVQRLVLNNDYQVFPGFPSNHGLSCDIHTVRYRDHGFGPQTVVRRYSDTDRFLLTGYDIHDELPLHHEYEPKESALFLTPTDGIPAQDGTLADRYTYNPVTCEWSPQSIQEGLFNPFDTDIGGSVFLNAVRTDGHWHVIKPGGGTRALQGTLTGLRTADSYSPSGDLPYTGLKIASVLVEVAPCSNPELLGTTVDVVDHSECVFDLPEADLDGVWVWASEGVADSRDPSADPGELTPCHWTADDRCCVPGE